MIKNEDKLEIGEKVRVKGTSLIGRISKPNPNDVGYRVVGYDEGPWDDEYMADQLERLNPPKFYVGQHLIYRQEGEESIAITVSQRRYETKLDCWFYQFHIGGPWFSESDGLSSFPQPQFNQGDEVILKDMTPSFNRFSATIVKPSVFRGNPAYEIILDDTDKHFNWLAADILSIKDKKLDLTKYLTDQEGEKFFSITEGEVVFKGFDGTIGQFITEQGVEFRIPLDDALFPNNSEVACLYPSKEIASANLFTPHEAWKKYHEAKPTYHVVVNITEYENQDVINDGFETINKSFPTKLQADSFIKNFLNALKKFKCKI